MNSYNKSKAKRDQGGTITVYLVTNALYDQYVPYIQAQLPDVNVEFIVGKITKNGKPLKDEDTFIVTCLATGAHFAPFLADDSRVFEKGESHVKTEWTQFVTEGGVVFSFNGEKCMKDR